MAVRAIEELYHYTPEEYLELERKAEHKSEYINGEIIAMSGGSVVHGRIGTNVLRDISNRIEGTSCEAFGSDTRVQTGALHYCYPDVTVICGKPFVEDSHKDTLLNPILIVEILSPSTQQYDRGVKFDRYKRVESLQEYVLISQDEPRIERFLRLDSGAWEETVVEGLESTVRLESIGIELELCRVYQRVEFGVE